MIAFLEGILAEKSPARVVINVNGVGYEVFIPLRTYDRLPSELEKCRILISEIIREDQHTLFGFVTEAERKMFLLLMNVSGIGPKLAMSALSSLSTREIIAAVSAGDTQRLASVSGIGRKTAERIIVELKDKFSEGEIVEAAAGLPAAGTGEQRVHDAVLALIALGYKSGPARRMVLGAMPHVAADASVEDVVRAALQH